MKKRMLLAAIVGALVILGIGAAASAGSSWRSVAPARPSSGSIQKGLVTVGSEWTLYDLVFQGTSSTMRLGPCEVLSFQSHGTFTGDQGDVGRWSGNIKLTFTTGPFFDVGTYAGKYNSTLGPGIGGFQGDDETGAAWAGIGPLRLFSGDDPLAAGDC
jgi:hypothetical protein